MQYLTEQNISVFLLQVFLLLGLARGLGLVFRRFRQPAFTAEILVGVILGPTVFGRFFPSLHGVIFPADPIQHNMLETVAWLGILFLLLDIGLEVDFSSVCRQKDDALKIAVTDIVVPMAVSFAACFLIPDSFLVDPSRRIIFSVFMATAMTISAMPIAARALHDLNLSKTDLGFLIVSALSINDVIGWFVFTLVLVFFSRGAATLVDVLRLFSLIVGFAAICLTLGRNFSNFVISWIRKKHLPEPGASLTFICLAGLFAGAVMQKIGIHALFGFFIAGIMAGQARDLSERTRQVISQMVFAVFVPLFFVGIGLKVDFLRNFNPFLSVFVTGVSMGGKFIGAWLGAKLTKVPKANHLSIAIAHTPGGTMEIVVGLLALQCHLINETVFVAVVFGAVASSVVLGPWFSHSVRSRKEISILEYFMRRAVAVDLMTDDRDEAIRKLCVLAAEQDTSLDADVVRDAVLKRENLMGTAMEEGIAVPHARLSFIRRPVIVFGRSLSGIEWNSPDGKPSHFIFLILTSPEDDVQVQILSLIAQGLAREEARQAIMESSGHDEVWGVLHEIFSARHIVKK